MKNKNKKGYRILQKPINVETDIMNSYMVLIETLNDKPVGIAIIQYPDWLKFVDEDYKYYRLNPN